MKAILLGKLKNSDGQQNPHLLPSPKASYLLDEQQPRKLIALNIIVSLRQIGFDKKNDVLRGLHIIKLLIM
jgi:hypothetical protein